MSTRVLSARKLLVTQLTAPAGLVCSVSVVLSEVINGERAGETYILLHLTGELE
mgnify:CR=1 FL=1